MISPLVSKVKRAYSPTVSKPPRTVTGITQIVGAHTKALREVLGCHAAQSDRTGSRDAFALDQSLAQ
jgi:hypothetical protein